MSERVKTEKKHGPFPNRRQQIYRDKSLSDSPTVCTIYLSQSSIADPIFKKISLLKEFAKVQYCKVLHEMSDANRTVYFV